MKITEEKAKELWMNACPEDCQNKDQYQEGIENCRHIAWAEDHGFEVEEDK